MSFAEGFVNNGKLFQWIIEGLIPYEIKMYCYVWMDDLAILAGPLENHFAVLHDVLHSLKENSLNIQIEKANFVR